MFFGRGESLKLDQAELTTLRQIERMVETGHIVALTQRQSEVALRAIRFYEDWEGAIRLLGHVRNVLLLFAGGLAFWWATGGENFVTEFIKGVGSP